LKAPVPETPPGGLSIAIETTADNLYFQASAKVIAVMPINPNGLISLKSGKLAAETLFL
jgi:hypothetical protein